MRDTLDSQQLRVFVVLARTSNMAMAATELGLTPSAVSHCLKALERDLGCRLFDRLPRRLVLSEAGRLFLLESQQILEQMESARRKVRSCDDAGHGRLSIAANSAACRFILAPALREFRESFPAYTISLCATAGHGDADFVVTADPDPDPALETTPIGEDDLLFYAHPLHPWVVRRKVNREELTQRTLILPERGSPAHARIDEYFREESVRVGAYIEVSDEAAAHELVRLDVGVGILPRWLAADAVHQGTMVGLPLGRRRLKRQWVIQRRRSRERTLAETLLASLCRSVFSDLAPAPEG